MSNSINERLEKLRALMKREQLSAFIFPSTDPHNGEYIPLHWEGRKWISGFTGSAGTAVVTMTSAALWTDSRYFIAAAEELKDTEFELMKLKIEGTPTIAEWLAQELGSMNESKGLQSIFGASRGFEVGVDGMVYSEQEVEDLKEELRLNGGITLRTNLDPLDQIWTDRPAIPKDKVEIQPLEYCGVSCAEKLTAIRKELRKQHADGMLVSALDDIAWTLNLRGNDVHCTPLFVSYLLITTDNATLYINPDKLTDVVKTYLEAEGVDIDLYNNVSKGLKAYPEYNILLDPNQINYNLFQVPRCKVIRGESPIPLMKAVKTPAEIEGYRRAMVRDGVALVKFQRQLMSKISDFTEISVDKLLTSLRAEQPLFKDISFDTIAGYGPHGAIVHYEATEATDVSLQPKGFILIDSGGQYQDGTTDITRTIALGPLTDEERLVYTLVLKGHIQLEMLHFPDGACGTQLDAVARKDMWKEGYNFLHGTGHGVGSYLSVHEGPHQIRMEYKKTPLRANMTVTDEPGIYVEGKFGVRIENTLLIQEAEETAFGKFLKFDPLTLCPIDTTPILWDRMLPEEIEWLNSYHERVYTELSAYLEGEDLLYLKSVCASH